MSPRAKLPGDGHAHRFDPTGLIDEAALERGLQPQAPKMSNAEHDDAVRRIAASYRAMRRDQEGLSPPWIADGEWAHHTIHRHDLFNALMEDRTGDSGAALRDFWRNDLGLIVKEYASFPKVQDKADPARDRFLHNMVRNWLLVKEFTGCKASDLATPAVGNPWGYEIDGTVIAPKAARYFLMATELKGMVGGQGAPVVGEIGAGYGGLAYAALSLAPHMAWVDYDLPETTVYAAYFLIGALGADRVKLYGESETPKAREDFAPGTVWILPNYALRDLADRSLDAMVNMFSLSEVGAAPLAAYLERIEAVTDGWFVHHNMDRPGVVSGGIERIPSSTFRLDPKALPLVSTGFDPFHGIDGDYRWFIHRRPAG